MEINTKKRLAVILSQLKGFKDPKSRLEQYEIDSEIASEAVWNAFYRREIEDKVVADLGCGTGTLGFAVLLMGAEKVFFVDIDEKAVEVAKENLDLLEKKLDIKLKNKAEFVVADVDFFDENVDLVMQNPPFGIQGDRHTDKVFLEKAFKIADVVYSFHKTESKKFINAVAEDNGFKVEEYWEFEWPLKQTMKYHKKKIEYIPVGCWKLVKK
ncbi:methyltransferase [Candidatus Woesearchaeota archaeon]|nr:methyltransferase [Candidatus Woesearchaeota archaeon]